MVSPSFPFYQSTPGRKRIELPKGEQSMSTIRTEISSRASKLLPILRAMTPSSRHQSELLKNPLPICCPKELHFSVIL
jgi:hypothetical protein